MAGKTALLVIDMQHDFTLPGAPAYYETTGEMMPRLCENINRLRELGVLIVIVYSIVPKDHPINPELTRVGKNRTLVEGTGGELLDERIPYDPARDIKLRKYAPSAFIKTDLLDMLHERGIENVLVSGVKTNVCCRATATDAYSYGFRTFMVSDMLATNTAELSQFHLDEMTKYMAKAIDSDEVFRRLDAGEL